MEYSFPMLVLVRTEKFDAWLKNLRDQRAVARISSRLLRAEGGNFGDVRPVGEGVSEMRVDYGPGYRVYFQQRGVLLVVLLCGGDKGSQTSDIAEAKRLAREWKD